MEIYDTVENLFRIMEVGDIINFPTISFYGRIGEINKARNVFYVFHNNDNFIGARGVVRPEYMGYDFSYAMWLSEDSRLTAYLHSKKLFQKTIKITTICDNITEYLTKQELIKELK